MKGGSVAGVWALIVRAVAAVDAATLRTAHGEARPAMLAIPLPAAARGLADVADVTTNFRPAATKPVAKALPTTAAGETRTPTPAALHVPPPEAPAPAAETAPTRAAAAQVATGLAGDGLGAGRTPAARDRARDTAAAPALSAAVTAADDQPVAPPPPAVWKEAPPPPVIAALPLPVRWFERGAEDEDDGGSRLDQPERQRRFIAEVDGGTAGRVQVDGLLKPHARTVSLIVRSERPLDAEARNTIAAILADGAALAGWVGDLAFRHGGENFVALGAPAAANACRLSV